MIAIADLLFHRGRHPVLQVEELRLAAGERLTVLGPSGSGKTTLLRLLAGLETPGRGCIVLDGRVVAGEMHVSPVHRPVTLLTQDYGLWAHLSAAQHVALVRTRGRSIRAQSVDLETLSSVGLGHKENARPGSLSGGEQQRLALARALAREASVMLLDEPFSNVDPVLSHELMELLDALHERRVMTRILVTHDMAAAARGSDKVAILKAGRIVQIGTWTEITANPMDPWCERLVTLYQP